MFKTRAQKVLEAESSCCPTCGHTLDTPDLHLDLNRNVLLSGQHAMKISPQCAEIVSVLLRRYPATVSKVHIITQVWGTQEPDSVEIALRTQICFVRRYLQRLGWTIRADYKIGYRLVKTS